METIDLQIAGTALRLARTPASKLARATSNGGRMGADTEQGIRSLAESIYFGVKRADPASTVTLDWIDENIDSTNILSVFKAFAEFNKFVVSEPSAGE